MQISEMYEQLGLFSTDKGTVHDYLCGYYNNEFKDLRESPLNILEIGASYGASIQLWKKWFHNANIIALDNEDRRNLIHESFAKHMIIVDAYSQEAFNMFEDNYFDYIIDDGPHTLDSQIISIKKWLDKVKPGGKLIIEDIQNIEYANTLILEIDIDASKDWRLFDLRESKGRIDDILLEITKNK